MSIELRIMDTEIVCDWGVFNNSDPDRRPCTEPPEHLMLITPCAVARFRNEPQVRNGGVSTISEQDGRIFVHLQTADNRWTWELFKAHWQDGKGPEIYVGRWPD